MEYYDGIFNPGFKISKLKQKYYLMHLEDIDYLKNRLEKTISQSPRLIKNSQLLKLIYNDNKIKNLEAMNTYNKVIRQIKPVLPKIKQKTDKNIPILNIKSGRPTISVTPDPRLKYNNSLSVRSVKLYRFRRVAEGLD
jgi:hypothetical protein